MAKIARRQAAPTPPTSANALDQGREAFARRAWDDAYRWLIEADALDSLACDDLDRLTLSAGLTGRDEAMLKTLERTHQLCLADGDTHLYVSSGTGYWGPPKRLGTTPEITRVVLRATS